MGIEIERKFLVNDSDFLNEYSGEILMQGYLSTDPERTVRVRIKGTEAWLTIKGKGAGIARPEFEYQIPIEDAREMLNMCVGNRIEKIRYKIEFDNRVWEVDRFLGQNEGLILAEIELNSEDEEIKLPEWIAQEVSNDNRYFNSYLFLSPFASWEAKRE
ncbi:CYTH domain-containing protein [Prolixibacteraceae bacterium JC049]|nr:CYTH domain-containing protein [Prolixibacteraceae bacterium JC049]